MARTDFSSEDRRESAIYKIWMDGAESRFKFYSDSLSAKAWADHFADNVVQRGLWPKNANTIEVIVENLRDDFRLSFEYKKVCQAVRLDW